MPNQTTNYGLTKPLASEFYDVEVQNGNMDKIDAQMKTNGLTLWPTKPAKSAVTKEPFTSVFRTILPKLIGHLTPLPACGAKPVIPLKNGLNGRNP